MQPRVQAVQLPRVFSENGRGRRTAVNCARRQRRRARRDVSGSKNGRRSRTNDVGHGAARLGGRGEARAREFSVEAGAGRGDFRSGRCSSPPSCRGGGSFSTRATCAGSCPSRASGGAAMFVKTLVRARTRSIARESPSRARPLADQLTQLLTRISFETTGARTEPPPRAAPDPRALPAPRPQTYATRATPRACR